MKKTFLHVMTLLHNPFTTNFICNDLHNKDPFACHGSYIDNAPNFKEVGGGGGGVGGQIASGLSVHPSLHSSSIPYLKNRA